MPKVSNKEYFTLQPLSRIDKPEETLYKAMPHLEGFDWWVSVGTAIGLYRDGDFIPDDTDIDIGIRARKGMREPELPMKLIRTTHHEDRITQKAYMDDNDCIIDLFFYYEDEEDGRLITWSESGKINKPNFRTKKLETKYGKLPFLHPIEDYLEDRYGDWRTKRDEKGKYEIRYR